MSSDSKPDAPDEVILIRGAPFDRHCRIDVQDGFDPPRFVLSGTASFLPYVPELLSRARQLWLGPRRELRPLQMRRLPVVNYLADPDIYDGALHKADLVVRQLRKPAFNAPAAVLRTGRDAVATGLAGIAGICMPRTLRAAAPDPAALGKAIEVEGLNFPVLIRPVGTHGGENMVKVDRPEDLGAVKIGFGAEPIYVTEFVDFADADGLYRKHRVVVVGDQIFLRHVIIGEEWLLHASRRTHGTESEEQAALAAFAGQTAPAIRSSVMAVADALNLDYFGIDCSLRPDGSLLVFEANACMNVLHNDAPSPSMWEEPIAAIVAALRDLLARPARWRAQPAAAA